MLRHAEQRCARVQKLTALQLAQCIVRSYPYYPDVPAIVLWLAAAENDACAVSLLQHAACSTRMDGLAC